MGSFGRVTDQVISALQRLLGDDAVSTASSHTEVYSRDMWPQTLIDRQFGKPNSYQADVVVWPSSVREVSGVVRIAAEHHVPLIPYGGGSGVCGGVTPIWGGITIDMKRMQSVVSVDSENLIADVEAGINGERFERELNHRGLTLGHFPSSIYCSTVGGWLATRAAGQLSNKYGKIEDRTVGLTIVTGTGDIVETDSAFRSGIGPNWTQAFLGSEGTLGVICSARLRVAPVATQRQFRGFHFSSVEQGTHAIRSLYQKGLCPAVVRLYDELDTALHKWGGSDKDAPLSLPTPLPSALPSFQSPTPKEAGDRLRNWGKKWANATKKQLSELVMGNPDSLQAIAEPLLRRIPGGKCLLIVGLEGANTRTQVESRLVFEELRRNGGSDLGEEPGEHWLKRRYSVSYKMSSTFRSGSFVDTMEVAATWDKLMHLYNDVRTAISRHAFTLAHFSHAYEEGCSIYFTFARNSGSHEEARAIYKQIWDDGLRATSLVGGTISHHHGVGLLKADYMRAEHRETMDVFRKLKHSLDPKGILNPGKLGL